MVLRRRISFRWRILAPLILTLWAVIIGMTSWQISRESGYRSEIVDSQLRLINSRIVSQINMSSPTLLNDFMDFIEDYYRQDPLFSNVRISIFNHNWEVVNAVGPPMQLSVPERRRLSQSASHPQSDEVYLDGKRYFCNELFSPGAQFLVISALPDDKALNEYLVGDRDQILFVMVILAVGLTFLAIYSSRFYSRNINILRDFARRSAMDPDFVPGVDYPHDDLGEIAKQIVSLHNERQHAVSQLKKEHDIAMHAIEEKSLQKRQLTNNINHELKTPIGVIKGYLETLVNMPDLDEETRNHFIRKALNHAERLADLIADVSAITRLEEGAQIINTECIDYHELVYKFAYDVRESGILGQIEFTYDVPMGLKVRGNVNLLSAMLMNLAKNTANYSCGTTCSLEYLGQTADDFYKFCFYDDGVGVPEESLEHIFDRFYRIDVGRSRKTGGTGLGLSIVYSTISALGGEIHASNRHNAGIQITFTLPIWTGR